MIFKIALILVLSRMIKGAIVPMTCGTSGVNGWDAVDRPNLGGGLVSGMNSWHSNHREDRQFRWYWCKPSTGNWRGPSKSLPWTGWDGSWTRGCGGNTALSFIYSYHNNHREDRRFFFQCATFKSEYSVTNCHWTGWVNDFDRAANFKCRNNGVVRSISSYHNNHREDRRFRFECCQMQKKTSDLPITTCRTDSYERNDWDGRLYVGVSNEYFSGMISHHNNHREDRRFKFRYCKPRSPKSNKLFDDANWHGGWSAYDGTWFKTCAGYKSAKNAAIVAFDSHHNNHREDRTWRIKCGILVGYDLINCAKTGWINGWDAAMNFQCPNNGVIRGIGGTHNNHREDRLYQLECCQLSNLFERSTGQWIDQKKCPRCTWQKKITTGVSTTTGQSITKSFAYSLEVGVKAGFEYKIASGEVSVTNRFSWETAKTISSATTHSRKEEVTHGCNKAFVWQWKQHFPGKTVSADVLSEQYICSDKRPKCPLGLCDLVRNFDCQICKHGFRPQSAKTDVKNNFLEQITELSNENNKNATNLITIAGIELVFIGLIIILFLITFYLFKYMCCKKYKKYQKVVNTFSSDDSETNIIQA